MRNGDGAMRVFCLWRLAYEFSIYNCNTFGNLNYICFEAYVIPLECQQLPFSESSVYGQDEKNAYLLRYELLNGVISNCV